MTFQPADYRDCLDLAGAIARSVECYESDDLVGDAIVPHLRETIGELLYLREIVAKLPHTRDGAVVVPGVTLYCPNGHAIVIAPHTQMSRRVYCCKGDCWSDGCQSDSGSGTHYAAAQCSATKEEPR